MPQVIEQSLFLFSPKKLNDAYRALNADSVFLKRSYFVVSIATAASHTYGRKRLFGEHLRILVKAVREHGRS